MENKIKLFERKRRKELSHKCGVYAIFVNNHIYVGSSEDLSRRLTEHRMTIPKGKKGCKILNELYTTNSREDFYYSILEYCTPDERLAKEKYYIEVLKADCNIARDPKNPITYNTPIYQYSNEGKYIRDYNSITEAARKIGGSEGNISIAAVQHRYAYNSLWSHIKQEYYPFTPKTKLKTKKVYVFDCAANPIHEFSSISKAAKFLMSLYNNYSSFNSLCNTISYHCSKKQWKKFNSYILSFYKTIYIPREQQ